MLGSFVVFWHRQHINTDFACRVVLALFDLHHLRPANLLLLRLQLPPRASHVEAPVQETKAVKPCNSIPRNLRDSASTLPVESN
jgi:hypothetical protein